MLLIIFLGLIATLTLVSGKCDVGTQNMDDFNWTKFSGPRPWCFMLHKSNDFENEVACPSVIFASPTGNRSRLTSNVYIISKQRNTIQNGYIENWNSSGYMEIYHPVSIWSGPLYVIAVKYNSYVILKHCPFDSDELFIYVAFRSCRPDLATVWEVLKELRDNNIDENQLLNWNTNRCPSLTRDIWRNLHIQTIAQILQRKLLRL